MVESVIDVLTTVFQANLAAVLVFTAGYIAPSHLLTTTVLESLNKRLLLPCLLFVALAGSSYLTLTRLLQITWPSLVLALVTHLPAIGYAAFAQRFFAAPGWIAQSVVYNNALSFPLVLLFALASVSGEDTAIGHLRWRVMDTLEGVVQRSTVYLVVNYGITQIARSLISPVVERISPSQERVIEDDLDSPIHPHPPDEEDATESTPLVPKLTRPGSLSLRQSTRSPVVIACLLGLIIALIKPVQRALLGVSVESGGNWTWGAAGWSLYALGGVWVLLDLVRFGASVREAEKNHTEPIPPTLGTVLTISLWRYVLVPLISLPLIRAFSKIPNTRTTLQDPAFAFTLALALFSPPTVFPTTAKTAFESHVLYSLFYTSLVSALPLAISIALSGRGVSYETNFNLGNALTRAMGGGAAGALAMVIQVLTLMPLRTVMNYQYRFGGSFKGSIQTLYQQGGWTRYYAGLGAAIFQGPFARFGDTAANAGILALLESLTWPVWVKTIAASVASASFRMILTPIDTVKTTQQTNGGKGGLKLLRERIADKGIGCLWYGALATAAATFVGHYPWFATNNILDKALPPSHSTLQFLLRQAFIGFAASVVSDTVSNSLRVIKTYRQTHEGDVGYVTAAKEIVAADGVLGLFGRGLATRLLTNGLQGLLFSILWKYFSKVISGDK